MISSTSLRIARPTDNLTIITNMYCKGLNFTILGEFKNHENFDGIMLGHPNHSWHLEFTHHHNTHVGKAPTQDNLLVFYIEDKFEWQEQIKKMQEAGFILVSSYNPYWDKNGKTFEDIDGYRVVLQNNASII
ncbi:VOC family protein [Xenorhabdus hominickii]|uniref:Glyoxalase n=1 Tax=Xenorhabdus hominickii TaxID=351679 RepID=A0A2G0QBC6_XENHO|nr:VOC family protein [Xenorhabdus hominickii]AOM40592.1 glyoxalase [Xenorhabdus hominickii]PHM56459.1 glyoxalase [Xenorhabdus hominickii]